MSDREEHKKALADLLGGSGTWMTWPPLNESPFAMPLKADYAGKPKATKKAIKHHWKPDDQPKEKPIGSHVMVDIETLGNTSTAAILSIGGVRFDPMPSDEANLVTSKLPNPAGWMGMNNHYFHHTVELKSAMKYGDVEPSTIKWWMEQPDAARFAIFNDDGNAQNLEYVLSWFKDWVQARETLGIWAHGVTFDIPIIASAYQRLGKKLPFSYRITRDTRTLFDMTSGIIGKEFKGSEPDGLPKHHALADAIRQARWVQEAYRAIGQAAPTLFPQTKEWEPHAVLTPAGADVAA